MAGKASWLAMTALALGACGAGGDDEEPPFVPAARPPAADTAQAPIEPSGLRREVFSYRGGARDPFESLLTSVLVGPELPDLTLVAIYLDHGAPDRSVATLRERITGRRYNLHPGDRIGRLRVADIRLDNVDFIIDDFGTQRRETLSLRRRQEGLTP